MKIEVYGNGDDDLVLRLDNKKEREFGAYGVNESGDFDDYLLISSIGGSRSIRVIPVYDGTWSFAFAMHGGMDDNPPVPPWKMSCEKEHGYSMKAQVESEADELLTVTYFRKGKEVKNDD